ncbi:amino acid permease [Sclerotinia borealis F-4128]|uniref:Amino acid permease n=1 Tax=Sclerotinia borealis (strain F-4128) TaxID=1432307 RepID=W9C560_SCLBF|nr:amino acid permease [Sclerotinia borealis F-4128]
MKSKVFSHPVTEVDTEKGSTNDVPVGEELKRNMKGRHINMIAIAGMIGTGLFLSSGTTIALAGPAGAWLAYIFMGFVTAGVSYTTGEITAFMPVTGGFVRHATAFVEPAFGAAAGWNFWYTMAISVPAELSAAATLIQFWDSSTNPASEVIFASMKIALIIGLIIAGLVVDLGGGPKGERLGFTYWKNPGPFNEYLVSGNTGQFLAFWSSLISAAFAYGNIQVVALSGTETANPRKIIPDATKKTFFRVFFFYVLSILIVGVIVPYDSEALSVSLGTAASSPFVIAFQAAGIKVLPSIINAVVCTSAISSGSACIYLASRTLYGLSADGHAPKVFMKCNRFGTPWYAVGLSVLPSPLVYMVVSTQASVVFGWFVNITTVAGLIGWVVIEVTYLRFFYALKQQCISRDSLPYKSPFQPYVAWITGLIVFLIVFFSGYAVFFPGNFTASGFLTYYINVAIFIVLYAFFKLFLKSKIIPLDRINFEPELNSIRRWKETSELMKEDKNLARRVWDKIF